MRIEPIHYWAAGVEIRPNLCTAVGDLVEDHLHDHPHMTMVTRGRWRVTLDGQPVELASASLGRGHLHEWIEVPGGVMHGAEVLELEDGVAAFLCLWPGGVK